MTDALSDYANEVANLGRDLIQHAEDITVAVALVRLKDGRTMLLEHVENLEATTVLLAWGQAINNTRLTTSVVVEGEAQPLEIEG